MNSIKNLFLSVVILIALFKLSQAQNCPTECLHLGLPNAASCSCDCQPAWEGTYCERAKGNCSASNQPSDCGTTFPVDFCIFDSIFDYCPQMCNHPACTCGIDECLNGGFFDHTTCECFCPFGFYGTICENSSQCPVILDCIGGTFNPNTCLCDYTTTLATSTSATTASTSATTASTSATTASTSISTGTTSSCQPIECSNGFIFNANTCTCPCGTGFSGTRCENYDCNTSPKPDDLLSGVCDILDCAESQVKGTCPYKCFCTSTTGASTTTVATTTTITTTTVATTTMVTTTTVASTTTVTTTTGAPTTTTCPALNCAHGLQFDSATCTCPCRTGFSGTLCENYDCNTTPTPDSVVGFLCLALTCSNESENLICPFKCLCGSTTTA